MKSAQVAEASLTILECPLLLMQIVPRQIGYFDRAKWPMTVFPPVNISFVNYGRTPAIVSHAGADVVLADNMPKNIKGRAGRRLVWITNVVLHKESLGEIELRVAPPHSLRSKKLP
jgi:hypothetical protein